MLRSYNKRTAAFEQLLSSVYVDIMECMYMYLRLRKSIMCCLKVNLMLWDWACIKEKKMANICEFL